MLLNIDLRKRTLFTSQVDFLLLSLYKLLIIIQIKKKGGNKQIKERNTYHV